MTGILLDFQLKLLAKDLKENDKREQNIRSVMSVMGRSYSGEAKEGMIPDIPASTPYSNK